MSRERRETARKHTYTPAFLFTSAGAPLGKCIVKDISQSGAKLLYSAADELPAQLQLTIGMNRRNCQLMWRRDKEVGVRFAT
jgi:PilZ domain